MGNITNELLMPILVAKPNWGRADWVICLKYLIIGPTDLNRSMPWAMPWEEKLLFPKMISRSSLGMNLERATTLN